MGSVCLVTINQTQAQSLSLCLTVFGQFSSFDWLSPPMAMQILYGPLLKPNSEVPYEIGGLELELQGVVILQAGIFFRDLHK